MGHPLIVAAAGAEVVVSSAAELQELLEQLFEAQQQAVALPQEHRARARLLVQAKLRERVRHLALEVFRGLAELLAERFPEAWGG